MLQELTTFHVTIEFGGNDITYYIAERKGAPAIIRLHKNHPYDSPHPLVVRSGPNLDQGVGAITAFGAWDTEGTKLGRVHSDEGGMVRASRWSVEQNGGPSLTGNATGVSALARNTPLAMVDGIVDDAAEGNVLPLRLSFTGKGSAGFKISRPAGARTQFSGEVHDPALDRRLVFATVVALNVFESHDMRRWSADFKFNPFRKSGRR